MLEYNTNENESHLCFGNKIMKERKCRDCDAPISSTRFKCDACKVRKRSKRDPCVDCRRWLVTIGIERKNGSQRYHDWPDRKLHKKCWKKQMAKKRRDEEFDRALENFYLSDDYIFMEKP